MLKTGLKSFVYSFSVSLFAIMSANKAFHHEKITLSSSLNIQNKSIALYLTDAHPSYAPVKKIALSSLPEISKPQVEEPQVIKQNIILASDLEPLDIPLEFVENPVVDDNLQNSKKTEITLANVLYAPDHPLPMPEIKAEPIYQPEENIEIKIASAPEYVHNKNSTTIDEPKPSLASVNTEKPIIKNEPQKDNSLILAKNEQVKDDTLIIARNATIDKIPLIQSKNNNVVNKVKLGDPDNLQHVALANTNITIQSMSEQNGNNIPHKKDENQKQEWQHLNDSPWLVAKSSGSKNLFMNKQDASTTKEELKDLVPLQHDKKGVLVASETVKNLIIPIPEDILNEKNITPRLAYPETSEDKKREININKKIQEDAQKKNEEQKSKVFAKKDILTPIDDNIEITPLPLSGVFSSDKTNKNDSTQTSSKDGFMDTLSSFFNKAAETASDVKKSITNKTSSTKNIKSRRKTKKQPITILPTEIRLSFQPNKAEISGQTLRWIQAFASKTAKTSNLALEIRIDGTSSTSLQQKRLNLLYNILTNKGVDYSMINTVFTNRDPNSFILRTISLKNDNNRGVNDQKTNGYIQW